jgi:antitoxin component YwqK of YwqJK toxin-antitoxin module
MGYHNCIVVIALNKGAKVRNVFIFEAVYVNKIIRHILKYKQTTMMVLLALCCFTSNAQKPIKEKYSSYYADSTLKEKGFYVSGVKDGQWFYYDINSSINLKEKWKKGILIWQIYYTPKGKISKTVDKNGTVKTRPACGC